MLTGGPGPTPQRQTSLYFRDRVSERDEWRNPDTEEKEIGRGAWVDRKQKGLLSRPGTGGSSETDGLGNQEGEVSGDRSDLEKPASVGVLPRSPLPAYPRRAASPKLNGRDEIISFGGDAICSQKNMRKEKQCRSRKERWQIDEKRYRF